MKKNIKIFVTILTIISVVLIIDSCSKSDAKNEKANSNKIEKKSEKIVNVQVKKIKEEPFIEFISVTGVVKPNYASRVSADEGGVIAEYYKSKGSFIRKGEFIARLKNDVQKAAMDAAYAQYQLSEMNFQKQEEVFNQNANSEIQFLNAKYSRDAAKANYELTKARYENTFIKSPFTGYIDKKFLEVGEMATPGLPLVDVVDLGQIKISAGVPERYLKDIKIGSDVKISFSVFPSENYTGKVNYVSHSVNTDNRTFEIEVIMNNVGGKFKPEIVADLNIEKANYAKAIVVNQSLISNTDFGTAVFVEKNGVAELRVIQIGAKSGNSVLVKNGLNLGDRLITVGYQDIVQGEKVKVVN